MILQIVRTTRTPPVIQRLLTTYHLLPIAYRQPPTANCELPTANRSFPLLTASCSAPAAVAVRAKNEVPHKSSYRSLPKRTKGRKCPGPCLRESSEALE